MLECPASSSISTKSDIKHQHGKVLLGRDCIINAFCHLNSGTVTILIGDGVRIAASAIITCVNHNEDPAMPIYRQKSINKSVQICNDVWIGANAIILPGIIIGEGSIVGAGAVVTKDIPPGEVWVGNPAKKLRNRGETT